jgi:hypothetical protein
MTYPRKQNFSQPDALSPFFNYALEMPQELLKKMRRDWN